MPRVYLYEDWVEYERIFLVQEGDAGYIAEHSIEVTQEFLDSYFAALKTVKEARSVLAGILEAKNKEIEAARQVIEEAEYQRRMAERAIEQRRLNEEKEVRRKAKGLLFKSFREDGEPAMEAYLALETTKGPLEQSVASALVEEFRVKDRLATLRSTTPEAIAKQEARRRKRDALVNA